MGQWLAFAFVRRSRRCAIGRADRGARLVARALFAPARRALVRLRVEGAGNLPAEGPAILAANHLSFFDSVLLLFALPRRVYALDKAE